MKTLPLLLIAAGSLASAFAQANSPDTPPQPPFLKRAPEKCEWQISTKSSGNTLVIDQGTTAVGHASSPPRATTVIKNGKLIFETTTLENGSVLQFWRTGGVAVMSISGKPWELVQSMGSSFEDVDYAQSDFAGFDWISQSNFIGRKKVLGRPCLLFKGREITVNPEQARLAKADADAQRARAEIAKADARAAGKPAPDVPMPKSFQEEDYKVDVTAYIDEETRLPVALVYMSPGGEMMRTYSFQSSSQMPSVPPEVLQLFQAYLQRQKMLGGSM